LEIKFAVKWKNSKPPSGEKGYLKEIPWEEGEKTLNPHFEERKRPKLFLKGSKLSFPNFRLKVSLDSQSKKETLSLDFLKILTDFKRQ